MFFFLQQLGGEDGWIEQLAEARQAVIASKKPRYVTVLDLSDIITDTMTREQIAAIRYRGPLYFDWDDPQIEVTINKVNQFREKLAELGVDASSCRWYATGGRGFHCEIPWETFLPKPPAKGVVHLPLIYREMAYALYTDAMDMRVYSARRGRMWRTPNVQRENGAYKVPVTPAELEAMTPAVYAEICATPRAEIAVSKPSYAPDLALAYEKARLKVEEGAKKRSKAGVRDLELLARFKGDWPPTVARLMANDGLKAGSGFHSIAMQIAITSNAIGKSEEDMLAAAAALIENHVSDGHRYNSPKKRRDELVRLFHYTKDNVCYSYSKGALKVLCADGVDTADLDGLPDDAGERLDQKSTDTDTDKSLDLRGGIEMRETGLYKKDIENGVQLICDLAFREVRMLKSMPTVDEPSKLWGYEADVLLQGESLGVQQIDMQCFLSKQRFQEFAMKNTGVMKGNDNDVAGLSTILRDMARASGNISYVVRREGMDYVTVPDSDPPQRQLVWAETSGVYSANNARAPYVFRPMLPSGSIYQADLMKAPALTGSEDERSFLEALFGLNDPTVVAPLIGWMTACFHRSLYGALGARQFPLCSIWGQQGSGKSQTAAVFGNMHFFSTEPLVYSISSLTPYHLKMHCAASASIPLLLDEYKPSEMQKNKMYDAMKLALRSAYRADKFGSGGDGEQIGQSWKSITQYAYTAPMLYIGESLESQSAIMERTISIPISTAGKVGRNKSLRRVLASPRVLSSVGRSLMMNTFQLNLTKFEELVQRNVESASSLFKPDTNHRPIYNLGVMLTGFDFFSATIRQHFGAGLDSDLARLRDSILVETAQTANAIMAEASKVLDILAYISNNEEPHSQFAFKVDKDYAFFSKAGLPCVDVKMQVAWVKYAGWCRVKGQNPLYDNYEAFSSGLAHYAPTIDKTCIDSPMKEGGLTKVYRFSLQKLKDEGVQGFKGEGIA